MSINANGGILVLTGEQARAGSNGCSGRTCVPQLLFAAGMCHRAEQSNINNRRYGRALLEREVASFTTQARSPRIAP